MLYRRNQGFIKAEAMIALLIILTILPLVVQSFRICANMRFDYSDVEVEITLIDLRRILLLSYDLEINDNSLNFIYKNTYYTLNLVNEKLLLQPGSQMFLNDVDFLRFYDENGVIYVQYFKNNKEYKKAIASANRFYLDEFSFDNDECTEPDDSNEQSNRNIE